MLRSCNQPDRLEACGARESASGTRRSCASSEDRIRRKRAMRKSTSRRVEQRREDLGREYMNVQCVPLGPGYVTAADIIQSNDDTCRVTP